MSKDTAKKFAQNWQRCRQEELPGLFYAYDDTESQSERLVTFRLEREALNQLYDSVNNTDTLQFIVHLGVTHKSLPERIPEVPTFLLMLQVWEKEGDLLENCYPLRWAPNGRFTNAEENDPLSGKNAIPAASAYLFVMSWMETPEEDLAMPFTAVSHVLGKRVKRYRFSNAESVSIFEDIGRSLSSGKKLSYLDVHLGNGLAVYDHPFSFRPVIEVKNAVEVDKRGRMKNEEFVARNATGSLNGTGDSFYDFGQPDPPPYEG
ncbi:MAG: hypothetical protein AB8H12_03845 [Lewinella sp.]